MRSDDLPPFALSGSRVLSFQLIEHAAEQDGVRLPGESMTEMNTIYGSTGEIIGICRFGVAWRKSPRERLGEYYDSGIYDNQRQLLGTFDGLKIWGVNGDVLGEVRGKDLIVNDTRVGTLLGIRWQVPLPLCSSSGASSFHPTAGDCIQSIVSVGASPWQQRPDSIPNSP